MTATSFKCKPESVDKSLSSWGNSTKTPGGVTSLGAEDAVYSKGVGYFLVVQRVAYQDEVRAAGHGIA